VRHFFLVTTEQHIELVKQKLAEANAELLLTKWSIEKKARQLNELAASLTLQAEVRLKGVSVKLEEVTKLNENRPRAAKKKKKH